MSSPGGEGESQTGDDEAEVESPAEPCRHELSTFKFMLLDWDGSSQVYPVCYLNNPDGRVTELAACRSCPSKPGGLKNLIREKKRVVNG